MSSLEDRAREDAAKGPGDQWGYRVVLDVGASFTGRWRGETLATGGDYGEQRLFLLWDRDGQECYMRGHAALARRVDEHTPSIGDTVAIVRSDDYESAQGTGYSYGLARDTCDDPLPSSDDVDW